MAAGEEPVHVPYIVAQELVRRQDVIDAEGDLVRLVFRMYLDLAHDDNAHALGAAGVADAAEEPVLIPVSDDIYVGPVVRGAAVGAADAAEDPVEPSQAVHLGAAAMHGACRTVLVTSGADHGRRLTAMAAAMTARTTAAAAPRRRIDGPSSVCEAAVAAAVAGGCAAGACAIVGAPLGEALPEAVALAGAASETTGVGVAGGGVGGKAVGAEVGSGAGTVATGGAAVGAGVGGAVGAGGGGGGVGVGTGVRGGVGAGVGGPPLTTTVPVMKEWIAQ